MNIKKLIRDAAIVIVSGIIGYLVVQAILTKEKPGNKKVEADEVIKVSYDNTSYVAKPSLIPPPKNTLHSDCKPRKLLYSALSSTTARNFYTSNTNIHKYQKHKRELESSSLPLLTIDDMRNQSKESTRNFRNAIVSQDYNGALAIMVRNSGIPSAISEAILLQRNNIPEDIVREMAIINKAVSFADVYALTT